MSALWVAMGSTLDGCGRLQPNPPLQNCSWGIKRALGRCLGPAWALSISKISTAHATLPLFVTDSLPLLLIPSPLTTSSHSFLSLFSVLRYFLLTQFPYSTHPFSLFSYKEYISCGKGRDMGFDSINGFNFKV